VNIPDQPPSGSFVIEVGIRQAWPFLTFCHNGSTPPTEVRLYIESGIEVRPPVKVAAGDALASQWQSLWALTDAVVSAVEVNLGGDLRINFESGQLLLVFGDQTAEASQPPWWFGRP
jgi:hypothetical protein